MELTHFFRKSMLLVLIFCTVTWAVCKKKAVIDSNKKVKFEPLPDHTYNTSLSTTYDAKGLQPLFDLANKFMDAVQSKNFGKVFKNEDIPKLFGSNWKKLIMDFELPIAITVGVGLLFVLFMPLVGFCFCCCRCCGNCGGDMKQSERYAAQHCKVAIMVLFLFIFTVLMLCGVLFMFVTNDRLHEAYENVPKTYDSALSEVNVLADNIIKDVDYLTTDQVACVTDLVMDQLGDTNLKKVIGYPLKKEVSANVSTNIDLAIEASENVTKIVASLKTVMDRKSDLVSDGATMKGFLTNITNELNDIKKMCTNMAMNCGDLKNIDPGNVTINYDSLPNMTKYDDQMKVIENFKLRTKIKKAQDVVDNIPQTVVDKSRTAIADVDNIIKKSTATIREGGDKIKDQIQKVSNKLLTLKSNRVEGEKIMKEYENSKQFERIRWIVYVALSALMAFIVFIMFCGLSCGSCGYNKEYMPTERSATSNCGGHLLMAAVGLMFLFSFILMIFCVLWFAIGMHLHLFCREIRNGDFIDDVVFKVLPNDFQKTVKNLSVQHSLSQCRKNKALYEAAEDFIEKQLNLTQKLDINVMKEVDKQIDKISFDFSSLDIMQGADGVLDKLSKTDIDKIDFTKIFATLEQSITSTNLSKIVTQLTDIANNIANKNISEKIKVLANKVKMMKDGQLVKVKGAIQKLKDAVTILQDEVGSIKTTGKTLLDNLKASQFFLQTTTVNTINSLVRQLAHDISDYTEQGITHIINQVKYNFAKCKPVANVYDGLINTFYCDNLIQNANGFWLSLGWCLLFFVPALILCVKLAKYFRKMDYSPGMDTIVVDHPPYNDKMQHPPYNSTPGYSSDIRQPPPYTSTQRVNPGYQHV